MGRLDPPSNDRKLILGSLAAMVVILLSACGAKQASVTVPESAQEGEFVDMHPCEYEDEGEEYDASCGSLVVPENRSQPDSRLIALPVIRVNALEDATEPIFWFSGGPGQSNMHFAGLKGLIETHDLVMVGYRGVDGSSVLTCPEMASAVTGVGGDLLSEASIAHFGTAMTECADRLRMDGVDLDGYSIPEVVEDMEDARVALGYDRVNLLGGSYGTRVAMTYAWMFPENLHRSVMIAVNPPGHFVWEPDVIDAQLAYDAGLCAADAECSASTDDLAGAIWQVTHSMPKRWLLVPIDPGKVKFLTQFMLFHRGTAAMIFDTYIAAERGDPSGLALMSLAYDFMVPSMVTWGDWAAKGGIDYDPRRDWLTEMNPQESILGSPLSLLVGGATQLGGGWPIAPLPDELREVRPTSVETLLVSGNIDYSTPSRFAKEELLPSLENGTQITLSEFGHVSDVWNFQPEARTHLLATFYESGEVDDSLFTYQPMDFHVSLGFPVMAKLALAFVVLIVAGLGVGGWLVVDRVGMRRR